MLTTRRADGSLVSRAMQTKAAHERRRPLVHGERAVEREVRRHRRGSARERRVLPRSDARVGERERPRDSVEGSRPDRLALPAGLEGVARRYRRRKARRRSSRPAHRAHSRRSRRRHVPEEGSANADGALSGAQVGTPSPVASRLSVADLRELGRDELRT